jgi:hypothetical protein
MDEHENKCGCCPEGIHNGYDEGEDAYEDDLTLVMRVLNDAMIRIEELEEKMSAQTEVNKGLGRAISILNADGCVTVPDLYDETVRVVCKNTTRLSE